MDRRGFLAVSLAAVTGAAAFLASIPFVRSLLPSARARGLSQPVEVDLSGLAPGQVGTYQYRGNTMLVLRRTEQMLGQIRVTAERALDADATADPHYVDPRHRAIDPEYLVISGVCTHLGCVPQHHAGESGRRIAGDWWSGGFICPCHQSGFDYAGRVVKGPAPRNLPVPPHRYTAPGKLIIGEEPVES